MKYKVVYQKENKILSQVVSVSDHVSLEEQLDKFDNIIKIKEQGIRYKKLFFRNRKKEVFLFFKQLDLMLQSHLNFNEALELILETNKNSEIKNIILRLQNAIIQGYPIDIALKEYKKYVGEIPIVFLKQGLETGTIKNSIHSIVVLIEQEIEINTTLHEKLRYPLFLILSLISSISIIFIYVIPSFKSIFTTLGKNLPIATEVLLVVNNLVLHYWYILILLGVSLILGILLMINRYRYHFDKFLLQTIPIIKGVVHHYQLYKLFLSLYITVESKFQFQIAIKNSIGTVTNLYLKTIMDEIQIGVKNGKNIAELFSRYKIFDHMVIRLLYTAENTGAYEIVLKDIANYYKESFNQKLQKLTSVIEPLIISIIALIVLWLILAIMVPIWQLSAVGL